MAIIDEIKTQRLPKKTLPKNLQWHIKIFLESGKKVEDGHWWTSHYFIPYHMELKDSKTLWIRTETVKGAMGIDYFVDVNHITVGYYD